MGTRGLHFLALGNVTKFYEVVMGQIASSGFEGVIVQVVFLEERYWRSSHAMSMVYIHAVHCYCGRHVKD